MVLVANIQGFCYLDSEVVAAGAGFDGGAFDSAAGFDSLVLAAAVVSVFDSPDFSALSALPPSDLGAPLLPLA